MPNPYFSLGAVQKTDSLVCLLNGNIKIYIYLKCLKALEMSTWNKLLLLFSGKVNNQKRRKKGISSSRKRFVSFGFLPIHVSKFGKVQNGTLFHLIKISMLSSKKCLTEQVLFSIFFLFFSSQDIWWIWNIFANRFSYPYSAFLVHEILD